MIDILDKILPFFSNREWALIVGMIILAVHAICVTPNVVKGVLKCLFARKLVVVFMGGFISVTICVWLLSLVNLWNTSLIKETVLYLFTSAYLVGKSIEVDKNKGLFRKQVFDNFKATTVITYFVNLYSFNFIAEFILLVATTFFLLSQVHSKRYPEYKSVNKFASIVLVLISLIYTYGFIHWPYMDWQKIFATNTVLALLMPILLGIMFIPYMYAMTLYSAYDEILHMMKFWCKKEGLNYSVRGNMIIKACGFNLKTVIGFCKQPRKYCIQKDADFETYVQTTVEKVKGKDVSQTSKARNGAGNMHDSEDYEILDTNHQPTVENFYVWYKNEDRNEEHLKAFVKNFRTVNATMPSNVELFDSDVVRPYLIKYPLEPDEQVVFDKHHIGDSYFDCSEDFFMG